MNDIALSILDALDTKSQIAPVTETNPWLDIDAAYGVSSAITSMRVARGERPIGWKIGFTNRTIWDEYGVHAPIWGPMYDSGVHAWDPESEPLTLDLDGFVEPRIEPEIIFRLRSVPRGYMNDSELLGCIEAVAHGFEIVQSVYPDWRFQAADTVAAVALHGALLHGQFVPVDPAQGMQWLETLAGFSLDLLCDGEVIDHGAAANVLDGPLHALRHFIEGIEERPMEPGLQAGDLISTGTLTRAFPLTAGQFWSTRLHGLSLPGMRLRCGGGAATLETLVARAARARFNVEHPESCPSPDAYEQAVADGVAAKTALARLLYGDAPRLREIQQEITARTAVIAAGWKDRSTS